MSNFNVLLRCFIDCYRWSLNAVGAPVYGREANAPRASRVTYTFQRKVVHKTPAAVVGGVVTCIFERQVVHKTPVAIVGGG